jgi:hypothetical protein
MPRHKATARPKVKAAVEQASPKPKPPSATKKADAASAEAAKDLANALREAKKHIAMADWLAGDLEIESGDYLDAHDFVEVINEIRLNPHLLGVANALKLGMLRYDLDAGWSTKKRLTAEELAGLTKRQKELAETLFVELLGLRCKVHRLNTTIQHIDETVSDVREILARFNEDGEKGVKNPV